MKALMQMQQILGWCFKMYDEIYHKDGQRSNLWKINLHQRNLYAHLFNESPGLPAALQPESQVLLSVCLSVCLSDRFSLSFPLFLGVSHHSAVSLSLYCARSSTKLLTHLFPTISDTGHGRNCDQLSVITGAHKCPGKDGARIYPGKDGGRVMSDFLSDVTLPTEPFL